MMLENSCRTCLEEIETAPISILTSLFDRTIFNFLCEFASIEMVGVEEQPQNICQTCFEALKNCHSFQQLIIKSDQKLRLQLDNIIKTEQVLEPECTLEIETVEEDFKSDLDEPTLKKAKIKKERVKIECENCSRKFSTKTNLKRHKCISPKNQTASSEENRTLRNRVECADCSKSFLSKMRLSQHSCIALPKAKPYTCTVCLKTFPYKTNLIAHSRIHTGEKPFKCKFCDKTFRFVGAQKLHERTHNEEKAFLCKFCGKGFHQAGQMNVHLRIHTGERPYICAECGRTFSDPSGFTKHRFQHAPVYAPCPICNKVLMKNGIQHHIKQVHIAKRNYSCTHCDKKFISLDVLKGHIRIHDGTKPFQCKICGKCFNQGGTLYNHMRVHTVVQKHKEKVELKAE